MEKNLRQHIATLKAGAPPHVIELWCQDEARLGLKPIVRRVCALRGQRPIAPNHTRSEWLYVYGFVRPATGRTYWLILPTVNTAAMNLALAEFARNVGAGPNK
ncbi:MAG: IS630 family transposase, partial [Chloroflexota bacterium]|nr:IS630 family transposase [Chloroflexota bacterium]